MSKKTTNWEMWKMRGHDNIPWSLLYKVVLNDFSTVPCCAGLCCHLVCRVTVWARLGGGGDCCDRCLVDCGVHVDQVGDLWASGTLWKKESIMLCAVITFMANRWLIESVG